MKIKEKILNMLFVRRSEAKDRWWNRLFVVLLLGSGIVVFVLSVFIMIIGHNHNWITYHPVAFSLEQNYQQAKGKEFACNWSFDTSRSANEPVQSIIECKGVEIPLNEARIYGNLYDTAINNLEIKYGLDKYFDTSTCPPSNNKISDCEFDLIVKGSESEQTDPSYKQYQTDLKNLARIKAVRSIDFGYIFEDVVFWLLIPIFILALWIVFWSSLIYRTVLYIIFGKENR
jgi:hypothetical protein